MTLTDDANVNLNGDTALRVPRARQFSSAERARHAGPISQKPSPSQDARQQSPVAKSFDQELRPALDNVISAVFGVAGNELFAASRGKARIALARQVAMYLAHVALSLSFTEVGRLFCRDRTTVAHACELVEDLRDDPAFDRALLLLEWAVPHLKNPRHSSIEV